ncbi:unnamed protein product [Prunus brigantina]
MLRHEIWPKSNGAPSSYEILKARIKGCVPDDVGLDPLPLGADMYTGSDILEGSLVLSPAHLENIRFSLHPLFHVELTFSFGNASSEQEVHYSEDWVTWLKKNLAGHGEDITRFADPKTLSEHSNMSAPRSLSVLDSKEWRSGKEPEQSAKKSHHTPQVVLGLNSPNVGFPSSTPSHRHPQQDPIPHFPPPASSGGENDFNPLEVWRPTFVKSNRSLVTLGDGLWCNPVLQMLYCGSGPS